MLNSIIISGRLVRDPELRTTTSGMSVTKFTLAVERDYTKEKQTDFIDCVAWRSTAEFVSKYFSKGRMAIVKGSLQSRKWKTREGDSRISWEVNASDVYFADSKPTGKGVDVNTSTSGFEELDGDTSLPWNDIDSEQELPL